MVNKEFTYYTGVILVLFLVLKLIFVLGLDISFTYPDEIYYSKLANQVLIDGKFFTSEYLPARNWGYISLNALLLLINKKAIYILNIFLCFSIKLKFLKYYYRSDYNFILLVPVLLLGLDYFSLFNLKDILVIWLLLHYFTTNNRIIKIIILILLYPLRIYLAGLIIIAESIKYIIGSGKKIKIIFFISIIFFGIYNYDIISSYIDDFILISQSSMELTRLEGYGMSGIDVLKFSGFLIGFFRFFLTPLPIGINLELIDVLKYDSLLLFVIFIIYIKRIKWSKVLRFTEFYLIILLTSFYAFLPFLAIPRHKYSMLIVLFLLFYKTYDPKRI